MIEWQWQSITSFDDPLVGSGTALNQVEMAYNDFRQLSTEYLALSGMVNTSSSPKIQYGYANGSSNQVRQLSVSYPSGRAIDFDYGSSDSVDERLSRVQKLIDGATTLVEYNYLGANTPVQVRYPQPDVTMDLWGGTAGVYTGLDRFGRLTDLPWIHDLSGSPTDLARIKYGYNRANSPTYARDEVARAANADLDQLYGYDGLQRLIDFQQGELSGTNTSISSSTLAQDWNLDQVGNWDGFNQEVTGILNQTRTHNRVNEITGIDNASGQPVWVDPGYDDAGNMTLTPRPNDPTNGFALTFDAWNRITKVETTDASPKLVAQYAYDGRNHRTSKRLYDSSGSLASTIEYFYNSDWQCVEEQETPVSSSTSTSTYVWGIRYIDDLVCRDTATDRLYAMQDRQYKMVGIIDPSGNVVERYSYTPYGETSFYSPDYTPRASSAYAWVYLYTSRRLDPETGLYYFRNRYYDPVLGRFCSRDPIGYEGASANLFSYVVSSPVQYTDPYGHYPRVCCAPEDYTPFGLVWHCQIENGPCPNDGRDWTEYPIIRDMSCRRTMPDGTPCCRATNLEIQQCTARQRPGDSGSSVPGDNCNTSVNRTVSNCCLATNWDRPFYATTFPDLGYPIPDPIFQQPWCFVQVCQMYVYRWGIRHCVSWRWMRTSNCGSGHATPHPPRMPWIGPIVPPTMPNPTPFPGTGEGDPVIPVRR